MQDVDVNQLVDLDSKRTIYCRHLLYRDYIQAIYKVQDKILMISKTSILINNGIVLCYSKGPVYQCVILGVLLIAESIYSKSFTIFTGSCE